MERLSDTAIEIINELHTERLDYSSEYIPLIDAANSLAAYEDLMERWKLRSIEEADRIFQRVNALGGTDLMAQYPEARIGDDGVLQIYPCSISASRRNAQGDCVTTGRKCPDCRREFWMQEVE